MMHQFYRGKFFDFEAIRILGTARYGGAEIAEGLEAIGHIRDNNAESWEKAWSEQARVAEQIAREAKHDGHREAARGAFLRSSNYTRAGAYMMTGDRLGRSDPRVISMLEKSTSLFAEALQFFVNPVQPLQIAYDDGVSLPAYLHLPAPHHRVPGKIPLVINFVGADSIQEEIFYMFPAAGTELGYAVLTLEGPGQGLMLHQHGLPMRPDWERVGKAALDYMFENSHYNGLDIDLDRVAVAGASLGGYFALRGAADDRCKACVAVDPIYDLYESATQVAGPAFFSLWKQGWIPDGLVNAMVLVGTRFSWKMRWEIFTSARFLGAVSPVEILRTMQRFTLDGYIADIKCPVLVTGAADALYTSGHDDTMAIFDQLGNPAKELWTGQTPGQGSLQAKMGALGLCNQRSFAFLDRQFAISRKEA